MRYLILMHRYLGIVIGILMVGWCLTGIVMMYVRYPALSQGQRLERLAPLNLHDCCRLGNNEVPATESLLNFEIENLGTHPTLTVINADSERTLIDLATGSKISGVSASQAATVAAPRSASARLLDFLSYDEWTVSGEFNRSRPLYRFALDDPAGTQVYISAKSGRVVQITTSHQRFWNWLGSVPHWLYFTQLRHQPRIWTQVVIWTSLAGCFLALFGLYLGVHHFRRRPSGRWSGYRGIMYWHHVPGLIFGLFALTWVASGLISMNPWGFLEGTEPEPELTAMLHPPFTGATLSQALRNLADRQDSANILAVESTSLWGQPMMVETRSDGTRLRTDLLGHPAPLGPSDWDRIATSLSGAPAGLALLRDGDAYYHDRPGSPVPLPVYRIQRADSKATRYYLDPLTGNPLEVIDTDARWYRWLHVGLHTFDFSPVTRSRPFWDVLMIVLLAGATVVCGTGTWVGWRRYLKIKPTAETDARVPRATAASYRDP